VISRSAALNDHERPAGEQAMIPVGHPYQAAGPIDFRSVLTTVILGTVIAILSGLGVWLWEASPLPTMVILTSIIQGAVIGLALAFMIGRLRLRAPKLLATIGLACGLASVAIVHYGHHLRFVDRVVSVYCEEIEADQSLSSERKRELIAASEGDPGAVADEVLVARTGHAGLVGSLIMRSETGVTIKHTALTGWGVWLLWGCEALCVAGLAAAMAGSRASEPFCEECGDWCVKEPGRLTLAGESAGPLAEAVRIDDTAAVASLRDRPAGEGDGTSAAGATLHACPGCEQAFGDVWHRVDKVRKGKTESTTKVLVKRLRVSPEMVALLRAGPSSPVAEPEG